MKNISAFFSNRLEILAEKFSSVIGSPPLSPMDEEIIIVQSAGMARWLSMTFAKRHGVCANFKFYFPNAFAQEIFCKVMPNIQEPSPFQPKIMTWRIMKLLQSFKKKKGFERIDLYLGGNRDNLTCYQLAERIADTFDQYQLFRPEMIIDWQNNNENHWQAILWRELTKGNEKFHRAALGMACINETEKFSEDIDYFPSRISIFGISSLPRFYLQIFYTISRFTDVNLFFMNPSKEYWGDIISESAAEKRLSAIGEEDIEKLYLEKGNGILASMGTLGRDFFEAISEFDAEEHTFFQEPGQDSLLSCLQSDILNLIHRKKEHYRGHFIENADNSIQINSCHSPMREIEVLHNWLLTMFEKNKDLMPEDILVMTPDIESYAPYIQAVFDMRTDNTARIPFTIADRGLRDRGNIINTFLAILDLTKSRFTAPEILSILDSQAIYQTFELSEADLDQIRNWVRDTRIRWGIDGQDKKKEGLPPFVENTWKAGIDRLILGYALPGKGENLFSDMLPYDNIEGQNSITLGKFIEFTNRLFKRVLSLEKMWTLNEWSKILLGLLIDFFTPDPDMEMEMQTLRQTIADLSKQHDISGFNEKIGIDILAWHIDHSLIQKGYGTGFMNGGVTFCAMLPMRSIPFKIIGIIGMNNDAYPRQNNPVGFDLIAKNPKPGDRSRRNDDRYLFLEALLSARKSFYISYIGQDIKDNSVRPPSVLVNELTDYIEQGFSMEDRNIKDHIFTRHRLQAFNPAYFMNNDTFYSYSEDNFKAAQNLLKKPIAPPLFISRELSELGEEWKVIDIDDLCAFFGNPAKFFLHNRLGIKLPEEDSPLENIETFEVNSLDKYLIEQDFLKHRIQGKDRNEFFNVLRASGRIPHGNIGECVAEEIGEGIDAFLHRIYPSISKPLLEPLKVDLNISGFNVTGQIKNIHQDRLIQYRYAKIRPKDMLKVWIYHVAMNLMKAEGYPLISMLAGLSAKPSNKDWEAFQYNPIENSKEIMKGLLEKYWEGLRKPLHFFPNSSWTYASLLLKNKTGDYCIAKASEKWSGGPRLHGEAEDPYYSLCFSTNNPLDSEFEQISKEIFEPLLTYQKNI